MMPQKETYDVTDFAYMLGRYCGFRWASDCEDENLIAAYKRHREIVHKFATLCERLAPLVKPRSDEDYPARDTLYLKYARDIPKGTDDLDDHAQFLGGFRGGANEVLGK